MFCKGKPKDPIWGCCDIYEEDKTTAKSKASKTVLSAKSERLKAHISRCANSQKTHNQQLISVTSFKTETSSASEPPSKKTKLQSSVSDHVVDTNSTT